MKTGVYNLLSLYMCSIGLYNAAHALYPRDEQNSVWHTTKP